MIHEVESPKLGRSRSALKAPILKTPTTHKTRLDKSVNLNESTSVVSKLSRTDSYGTPISDKKLQKIRFNLKDNQVVIVDNYKNYNTPCEVKKQSDDFECTIF